MKRRKFYPISLSQGKQLMYCDCYSWVNNYAIIYYYFKDHFGKLVTKNVEAGATIKGEMLGSKIRAYNELWNEIRQLELNEHFTLRYACAK